MANIFNLKFIISILLIFIIIYYYFYNDDSNIVDDKNDLAFLKESKNIEQKDFVALLESIMPKREHKIESVSKNIESKTSNSKKNIQEDIKQEEKPLKLLAILNNSAYITNGWYEVNDTILHNNTKYKVAKIEGFETVLIDSKNPRNRIVLEMFVLSDDIFFKKIK
ncbi:hypothetical protein DCO58_00370 [Helicobacter saguini]|uniref:Uncharacterized protein n=1 Tax=Helicobacter saguini TaxID=1548018 RepID=A0A347VQU6_9HELI|nr:hypothetical protein [Helicobacter saguini]MWV63153.1 hypothetical protein [Helicobacter saguini]MWV66177.1 hypothetical protein [Helicobacter saguini]MWV68526.1 hypothetical protein [Helicobacter saguini]MWV71919.1 hypothetical protein [Helicobacter saguini]TLD95932.1 hypothetical protein LS64_000785 [Helicobacter saguini]